MAEHTVKIQDFAFTPSPAVIAVGDTVVWENLDPAAHNAVRNDAPTFATKLLAQNERSAPITFTEATSSEGIEYFCGPHQFMKGRIIVTVRGSDPSVYSIDEARASHTRHGGASKK